MKFWKQTIEAVKDFDGTSPPSIFVGSSNYPKVFMGILSPPVKRPDADMLDSPEKWYAAQATIEQILGYRSEMIYSRFETDIKPTQSTQSKLIEIMQEVAINKNPTELEVKLQKSPIFKFNLDMHTTPIGNPAPLRQARVTSNVSGGKHVEYVVSDVDYKAVAAISNLYKYGIPVSRLQKMMSAGLLGMKIERKFVPTRWGITAIDDVIGKMLREEIKDCKIIDSIRLFSNEYIGNKYFVLLVPDAYQYELVEIWNLEGMQSISADYEPYDGRKTYASTTAGAFYAGRLAATEYLRKIKRQASILIVREVSKEYSVPMGIWQMRETVRGAFAKKSENFSTIKEALQSVNGKLASGNKWIQRSKLLKILNQQTKVTQFGLNLESKNENKN